MTTLEKIKRDLLLVGEIKYPWETIPVRITELKELIATVANRADCS